MNEPVKLTGIRNITVSGRIGTGKTTLAKHLAEKLNWGELDVGKIIRRISKEMGMSIIQTTKRPDKIDVGMEKKIKSILRNESNHVIQSHLAGFDAQGIEDIYKILLVCKDKDGKDKRSVRIDRLMNREGMSSKEAKREVIDREEQNLIKYRKLYANNDQSWFYWDEKYYDLVVNTYSLSQGEALEFVLKNIGFFK